MPITKVQAPDGSIIKVEHPEGASQQEIIAFAESQYRAKPNVQTVGGAVYRDGQVVYDPTTDPTNVTDPTAGMSTYQKFMAGVGGKFNRAGLAVKDLVVGADEELAAARKRDEALYNTRAGALGGFTGDVAASVLPYMVGAPVVAGALRAAPSVAQSLAPAASRLMYGAGGPGTGMASQLLQRGGALAGQGLGSVAARIASPTAVKFGVPAAIGATEFSTLQGTIEDQSRLNQALTGATLGVLGVKAGDVLSGMGRSIFGRAQDEAVKRAQKAGYQVSSSAGGRSSVGQAAEAVVGGRESSILNYQNQANTDRLAKKALGITLDDPIETGISQTKQPYNVALDKIKGIKDRFSPDKKLTQDLDEFMADYDDIIEAVQGLKKRDLEGVFMGEEDAFNPKQLVEISRYLGGRAKKLFKSDDTNQQGTATRLIQVKSVIDDFLERKVGSDLANEFAEARTKYAIASNIENARMGEHVDAKKLAGIMGDIKSKSSELNAIRDAVNAIPGLTTFTTQRAPSPGMIPAVGSMVTTSPAAQALGRTYPTMMGPARAMGQPVGLLGGMTPAQAGILGLGLGGE